MIGQRSFHDVYAPDIEVLRRWTNEASFVVLAHPVRNHFEVDDGLLGEVDGLEVWNQQYEGKRVPRVRSLHLFSELRNTKSNLIATGGVDFHRKEHFGAPTVTLDVAEFTEDTILEKLKNGAFTVSSPQVSFCGTLPNAEELASLYRWQSHLAVSIIVIGKTINAILASVGISLPKSLKQLIRKSL